jgi:predicted DNA-binding ribbon-helix-helix protein
VTAELDTRPRKRSVTVAGHRTSISLEPAVWDALFALARAQGRPVNAVIAEIDAARTGPLSSAVRVWVLHRLRERAGI